MIFYMSFNLSSSFIKQIRNMEEKVLLSDLIGIINNCFIWSPPYNIKLVGSFFIENKKSFELFIKKIFYKYHIILFYIIM